MSPALEGDPAVITDESSFHRYLELFNAPDNEGFTSFYTDDVRFDIGAARLVGRAPIIAFYEQHQAHLDEKCELLWLAFAQRRIAVELEVTFRCFADWPEFPPGPLVAGDIRTIGSWVHYDVRDGKISHVRVTAGP